jgi:hypothetical protein
MSLPVRRRAAVVSALRDMNCDFVAYVPSNSIADIITGLEDAYGRRQGGSARSSCRTTASATR